MGRTAEQRRIGAWMKYAAHRAGLTAGDIQRELGLKTQEAVYRWWGGERSPSGSYLPRYARVVGRSVEYFYQAGNPPATRGRAPTGGDTVHFSQEPLIPDLSEVTNEALAREFVRRLGGA